MSMKKFFVKDKSFWKTGLFDTLLVIIAILLIAVFVNAEPSNQYIKVYLEPFYRASMTNNQNYDYTLIIESPDDISKISSAIISFDVYISPTISFNLTINGKSCKNPIYTISTTYASAGQSRITFDCTNIIIQDGIYNIRLKPIQSNTGTITGWADITYTNNPKGRLSLHGTEYVAGDDGKMFLQFLDTDDIPVNNSECFLTIWYPNNTLFLNNTLMSYIDEGIYYKNFLVPNIDGVYPSSAKCYRPIKFNNIILYNQTYDGFESNNWIGGYNWSECSLGDINCQNGWDYDLTLASIVSNVSAGTGGCYKGNYCALIKGSYGFIERGFPEYFIEGTKSYNISYWFKFSGFQNNELAEIYLFDGNWHLIQQIGLSGGYSNNVWYEFSYLATDSEFNIETLLLGFYAYTMPSSNDNLYIDDVSIDYIASNITLSNDTQYQILRGSGEVHIGSLYDSLNNSLNNISYNVWNYHNRSLTYYEDKTNYSYINGTIYPYYTSILEGMVNIVPPAVWSYTNRSLTYYENFTIPQVDLTNYTYIFEGVWFYPVRNLTYYPVQESINYTLISANVWDYVGRYVHGVII